MLSREEIICRLVEDQDSRASYIRAKLGQLIPSQIRALRLKANLSQKQLGEVANMKQSRISASESGMANFSLETLIRLAASLKIGLQVKFVAYSEMRDWGDQFSQDKFTVKTIEGDSAFLDPDHEKAASQIAPIAYRANLETFRKPVYGEKSVRGYAAENGAMYEQASA